MSLRQLLLAAATLALALGACTSSSSETTPSTNAQTSTTSEPLQTTTTEATTTTNEVVTTVDATVVDSGNPLPLDPEGTADRLTVRVETVLSHDDRAVTTGLEFFGDDLIESNGLYGRSSRQRLDAFTGDITTSVDLEPEFFGQGLTFFDDRGWQLSWREEAIIVFNPNNLVEIRRFPYTREGWGICATSEALFTSAADGEIQRWEPDAFNFNQADQFDVTLGGEAVTNLAELECANDEIWAVVWPTAQLVAIDPESGQVTKIVDASRLVPAGVGVEDVLGALAYRENTDTWFLTGRRWDVLYEVSFVAE